MVESGRPASRVTVVDARKVLFSDSTNWKMFLDLANAVELRIE